MQRPILVVTPNQDPTMSTKIDGLSPMNGIRAIGLNGIDRAGGDRSKPVDATLPSDSIRLTGEAAQMYAIERSLRDGSGIDFERVAQVKAALAAGTYVIDPGAIADGILNLDKALFE
jgi:negative regulator of flagellin synthesis FlgM